MLSFLIAIVLIAKHKLQNCKLANRSRCKKARLLGASIGQNVTIRSGVIFKGHKNIVIEDNVFIGENTTLVAYGGCLKIGNDVLIAENAYFNTRNHRFRDTSASIRSQGYKYTDVIIEDNVWIGRGAAILAGSYIENGAVIGANTVINAKTSKSINRVVIDSERYGND